MKVAAVQMDVKIGEKERNLARVLEFFGQAASAGAKLVVFPECALSGYCFTSRAEAEPAAETVPGAATDKIFEVARKTGASAVVGLLERAGAKLFNSAAVIGPGGLLGVHRKIHLLCLGIDRYDDPGDIPFPVFSASGAKLGVNICFDCSFPESGRVVKLKGAQVLAIPTNWPARSDTWQYVPKVRAIENHLYVVAADRVGVERGVNFVGRSQIINPNGDVLAEAGETEETILSAEIEPAASDDNRVVRIPGEYEFDRIAARRPETYGPITAAPSATK